MADLNGYITSVSSYITHQDGIQLAKTLKLPLGRKNIPKIYHSLSQRIKAINILSYCTTHLPDQQTAQLVSYSLLSLVSVCENDWLAAYQHELEAYNAILNCFRDDNSNWYSPVLLTISNDLRLIAMQVDIVSSQRDNETLRDALRNLTNGFNLVAKDRTPFTESTSKKRSIFGVTNVLFKIYFKLNTLQLCSKLINVVERPGALNALSHTHLFPVSDVVTYKFYIGRLKMFEDKYEEARDCFLFALRYTPISEHRNRQHILLSLVPVQMSLGVMPSAQVGERYGLSDLFELSKAVKKGDLKSFEEIMERNQREFIRRGIYLVLEQVKIIAYRNLLKKIFSIVSSTRIKLTLVESAIKNIGDEEVDLDEIECIVANLIYQNKVKGYISHQKRTLILSKADPFPKNAIIKMTSIG